MKPTLDTIERFTLPFDTPASKWIFTETRGKSASEEDLSQIFPLTQEAAMYLKGHAMNREIKCTEEFFKTLSAFEAKAQEWQAVKSFLHALDIPFGRKVFVTYSEEMAFLLTWKMLIKYSHRIFTASDKAVWDLTLNWKLEFIHPGSFVFGKDFQQLII